MNGIENAVNEGQRGVDQRHFGAVLQVLALVLLNVQTCQCQLFAPLLHQVVQLVVGLVLLPLVQMVEEPEHEDQQHDGHHDDNHHDVLLAGGMVVHVGTGLQLPVLPRLLLQVNVDVTVIVAARLVVNRRISHRELFAYAGHEVGSLVNLLVRECQVQVFKCQGFVIHSVIARGQRTVGTGYLIDIAITSEQL